jgi:hypothetical protein
MICRCCVGHVGAIVRGLEDIVVPQAGSCDLVICEAFTAAPTVASEVLLVASCCCVVSVHICDGSDSVLPAAEEVLFGAAK